MVSGFFDTSNWFIRWMNTERPVTDVEVEPGDNPQVIVVFGAPIVNMGPDIVTYSPPPFDLVSATVRPIPAAAFSLTPTL